MDQYHLHSTNVLNARYRHFFDLKNENNVAWPSRELQDLDYVPL